MAKNINSSNNEDTCLTTIDNPFSPFSQFKEWYLYDLQNGYDCCGILDRSVKVDTSYLSEDEEDEIIEQTINEIVNTDPTGVYVKVKKVDPKTNENKKDFAIAKTI